MTLSTRYFKKGITLVAMITLGTFAIYAWQTKTTVTTAKQIAPLPISTRTSYQTKSVSTADLAYAQYLTPEQVKFINAAKLPAKNKGPLPKTQLPPPSDKTTNTPSGRCLYNNQSYTPGDMVKTNKGWIRCTPVISFNDSNAEQDKINRADWIIVQ